MDNQEWLLWTASTEEDLTNKGGSQMVSPPADSPPVKLLDWKGARLISIKKFVQIGKQMVAH